MVHTNYRETGILKLCLLLKNSSLFPWIFFLMGDLGIVGVRNEDSFPETLEWIVGFGCKQVPL